MQKLLYTLSLIFITQITVAQSDLPTGFLFQIGQTDSLYSKALDEYRELFIQLPEGYDPEDSVQYPVVYILDGEVLLPTVALVQSYYSGGFTPEMILVGISNARNRTRDLTPTKVREMYGQDFWDSTGGAEQFSAFIEQDLFPYIESKYSVSPYKTLIGHSYAGLFALHTFLEKPDLFNNYIAIDPSLDWDAQVLLKNLDTKLKGQDYTNQALFISLSGQLNMQDQEVTIDNVMEDDSPMSLFARSNIEFSNRVKAYANTGLSYSWKFYENDLHGTVPFPSIHDGLIACFEWYQMENTFAINNPETSVDSLRSIIAYRAQKLERQFGYFVPPYPEDLLNISGYMNMDFGQMDKAKMYFEYAIQYYPKSPNLYDSMADFYERNADYISALAYVKKAFALDDQSRYAERIERLQAKIDEDK